MKSQFTKEEKSVKIKCKLKAVITFCIIVLMIPILHISASNETRVIKVGYFAGYTDIINDIDSHEFKGYGYEVFKKMSEMSNFEFEFVPIEGDIIEELENGTVDVGGLIIRNEEREQILSFSESGYSKSFVALTTDDHSISYADFENLNGKTVATYEGNIGQPQLDEICEEYGISVEYVYGAIDSYMYLDTDYYITFSETSKGHNRNNILNLGVYDLHLASSLENVELIEELDKVFRAVVATEGNFFLELDTKYLADDLELNHRSLTENEKTILKSQTLVVGYLDGYQPISYTNEDGEPSGAMIDTMDMLAEEYGFEVEYYPYSDDDMLAHDNFDIILSIYGDTEDELHNYEPTETYHTINVHAQMSEELYKAMMGDPEEITQTPKIGTLKYMFVDYEPLTDKFPDSEIIYYNGLDGILDAYKNGEVDIALSTQTALSFVELYMQDTERVSVGTDVQIPVHILISKDIAGQYVPIFNVMIDKIAETEYENILINNSNEILPETTWVDFILDNMVYIIIGAIMLGLIFVIYILVGEKKKKADITNAYNSDKLTGFMAMHKFRGELDKVLLEIEPNKYEVISFDIDMFKTINTHYSHERGTEVIVAISDALKESFKNTSAKLTRRTADQFIIFREINEGGSMEEIYNTSILPSIQSKIGEKYNIALSFGDFIINAKKEKSSSVIGKADNARTLGKNKHETTFVTFDAEMQKQYDDKINITFRMEQAMKDREFYIVFQPKIDFKTMKINGAEALMRWQPKFGEPIYPEAFIPIFEQNGFILALDMYILEEVCKFVRKNVRRNVPRISVNISTYSILEDCIEEKINDIIEKYEIEPSEIEFEIAENTVVRDEKKFIEQVNKIKGLGFIISMDDFGANLSSLNRLSEIDADILKLDKVFFDVREGSTKKLNNTRVVVTDVIKMAKHLEMTVVAEGVETFSQALWLRGIGCDSAQGYYFERPLEEKKFLELIASSPTYNLKP